MISELTREQIESVFRGEVTGRIGCHAEGRTYIVPISYAYDGECVYAHSASGLKIRAMRANPTVCFEVEQIDDLANWRCVIAWGTYEELVDSEADRAERRLAERLAPFDQRERAAGDGTAHGGGPIQQRRATIDLLPDPAHREDG